MILELILLNQTIPEITRHSSNEGYIVYFIDDWRQVCYKKKIIRAAFKMLLRSFSETIFRRWQCYLKFEG